MIDIKTSYDNIVITVEGNYDSVYYKLYCRGPSGTVIGSFTRENNQYIMNRLKKNTEYTIEVQKTMRGYQRHTSMLTAKTLFCSPPRDVSSTVKNNTVTFTWKSPLTIDPLHPISEYNLEVRNYMNDKVDTFTYKTMKKLKISCDLDKTCSYQFTLYAKAGDLAGCKVNQENIHLKHRLVKICHPVVKDKNRTVYLLKPNETKQREGRVTEKDFGDNQLFSGNTNEYIILLVGETGAGQSTWINALANFMFGVTKEDRFRFKSIEDIDEDSQTESKTQFITIYRLRHQEGMTVNHCITLIDTPGFGDTQEIGRDTNIETEIHALFRKKNGYLEHINAVAFVMHANTSRLTPSMKYILDSTISLFGKDLKDNLFLFGTYGITKPKNAIDLLKGHNIKIKRSYHFENGEVLKTKYSDDTKGSKNTIWVNTMEMLKKLTTDLHKMPKKSVSQTQDVLEERDRFTSHVGNLQIYINDGIKILDQFKKEYDYLQDKYKKKNTIRQNTHNSLYWSQIHQGCWRPTAQQLWNM